MMNKTTDKWVNEPKQQDKERTVNQHVWQGTNVLRGQGQTFLTTDCLKQK